MKNWCFFFAFFLDTIFCSHYADWRYIIFVTDEKLRFFALFLDYIFCNHHADNFFFDFYQMAIPIRTQFLRIWSGCFMSVQRQLITRTSYWFFDRGINAILSSHTLFFYVFSAYIIDNCTIFQHNLRKLYISKRSELKEKKCFFCPNNFNLILGAT